MLLAGALSLAAGWAQAVDWTGEVALGVLSTGGNSRTFSANGKFSLDFLQQEWWNRFEATALSVSESGVETTERYTITEQLGRNLTDRDYLYGVLDYERDLFGGVRRRLSATLGYGRRVVLRPDFQLDGEIGAGNRKAEAQVTRDRSNEAVLRGRARYLWDFSETGSFEQSLIIESGASNRRTELLSELELLVVGNVSLVLSVTIRNNTDVAPGTEHTDTFTALNVAYRFSGGEPMQVPTVPAGDWRRNTR